MCLRVVVVRVWVRTGKSYGSQYPSTSVAFLLFLLSLLLVVVWFSLSGLVLYFHGLLIFPCSLSLSLSFSLSCLLAFHLSIADH